MLPTTVCRHHRSARIRPHIVVQVSDLLGSNPQDGDEGLETHTASLVGSFQVVLCRETALFSSANLERLALEFHSVAVDEAAQVRLLLWALELLECGSDLFPVGLRGVS